MPITTSPQNPLPKKPEKRDKVVSGTVSKAKKTLGEKFKDTFIAEDFKDVRGEVGKYVIVPKLKEIVASIINETINRLLFGQSRNVSGGSTLNRPFGSGNIHVIQSSGINTLNTQQVQPLRSVYNYQKLRFEDEADAVRVLTAMVRDLTDYKNVSIAAMNEYAGTDTSPTDNNYGWKNLDGARVERDPEGYYVLVLPKPSVL